MITSMSLFAQKNPAYVLYNSKGKRVKYGKLLKKISSTDLLFIGEEHNNPIVHWLQLEITSDLYDLKGKALVLGAEMIEADDQIWVDQYFSDTITEAVFEDTARLWGNYKTDYKPLVVFAKDHDLPFIASNIPRRYASMVYKQGIESLDNLDEETKAFIAPLPIEVDLELPGYKGMLDMMAEHGGKPNENFPKAQAVKDATMGHFIVQNWQPGKYFIHYNGLYHSNNYEGIIWYVNKYNPAIKIKTITTVSQKDISKLEEENKGTADFIICVPENMTRTY